MLKFKSVTLYKYCHIIKCEELFPQQVLWRFCTHTGRRWSTLKKKSLITKLRVLYRFRKENGAKVLFSYEKKLNNTQICTQAGFCFIFLAWILYYVLTILFISTTLSTICSYSSHKSLNLVLQIVLVIEKSTLHRIQ